MNKFKLWLKTKIIKFLEIDKDRENYNDFIYSNNKNINNIKTDIQGFRNSVELQTNRFYERFQHNDEAISTLHNTIENVVHIATDIEYRETNSRSWAVVCVEGKINIVKFIDLNGRDAREIMMYLKQYEAGRHCIDFPGKDLLYDGFFKF
jgi:uncharacterized protein YbaA (DUF1428 family)